MADIDIAEKAVLDAETDQAFAAYRDKRASLTASGTPEARFALGLADGIAGQLREQFPGQRLGYTLMAVAQTLACAGEIMRAIDPERPVPHDALLAIAAIAAIAAEQLEREP